MKNKKVFLGITLLACCVALTVGIVGCAASSSGSSASKAAQSSADPNSLVAYHEGLGQDYSKVTEVSIQTCTSEAACHGGSWDSVVEETDALWAGFGQIPDANPHMAHATNAFECADCHSLEGVSVNQCNGCHNFDTPSTWEDKDPASTTYGAANDEPLY